MTLEYFLPSYLKGSQFEEDNKKRFSPLLLPTHWNSADGDSYITVVDEDKLSLEYSGPGRSWIDAASIRSNNYIPPEVGLYYFEITVIDCGRRGCIGIGLSKPGTRLNRMPGWEPDTIGYHGDDGHLYYERGTGRKFGPLYTTGETVGCGINYCDKEVFFTKNGINLGAASKDRFDDRMIPTCGMESPNESATVNFGTRPFVFDINTYAKIIFARDRQKKKETAEVTAVETANENTDGVTEDVAVAETVSDGNVIQQPDAVANSVPDTNTFEFPIGFTIMPTLRSISTTTIENSALEPDPIPPPVDEATISGDAIAEQLYEVSTGVTEESSSNVVGVATSNVETTLPPDVVTVVEDNDTTQNTIDVSSVS